MRLQTRNKLIELLSTIMDGVKYIKKANLENAKSVFDDCIFALQFVSDNLEENLSKERFEYYDEIVKELVSTVNEIFSQKKAEKQDFEIGRRFKKLFSGLKRSLSDEPEVKLEILFLPYKASMWDSLESIWKVANDDPRCDAYVMPIPYYDRAADGSLSEFHYEGEQFPKYVSITSYKEYNIEKQKPDIIYIHNPYDMYNRVTSVAPEYYSNRLKQYTDMLVYVPYFFKKDRLSQGHLKFNSYKYIDKIVVQSNDIKRQMEQYLPKDKVLALGSPKADRMIYLDENKPPVPKEWADIIGNKKAIFFNTSIGGLLYYRGKALEKVKYIFDCLKNRDDVVLIWRPHPLLKATLKSMLPELLPIYEDLEERFVNEKIGIFDTTPDVNITIAICDAYIGEGSSSVVPLFGVTGKPIFATIVDINAKPTEENRLSIHFTNFYKEDNDIWFVSYNYNSLCKMDINSGEVAVLQTMINKNSQELQCSDIVKANNKFIFIPNNARDIMTYDLDKERLARKEVLSPMSWGNFNSTVRYKESLFMIPYRYPAILQYNIKSNVPRYHTKPIEGLMNYANKSDAVFGLNVCVRENKILMPLINKNKVLEFNMDDYSYKEHTVGSEKCNYYGIEYDGQDYWLIPYDSTSVVKWNYETGSYTEYNDYPQGFKTDARKYMMEYGYFINIINCGFYMLAFPLYSNMIIKIDISTGQMSEFKIDVPYKEGERKNSHYFYSGNYYFAKKYDDNTIIAQTAYDDSLLFIDINTGKCRKVPVRIKKEDADKLSKMVCAVCEDHCGEYMAYEFIENSCYSVSQFLDDLVSDNFIGYSKDRQKKAYSLIVKNLNGTCGEKTHKYIKEKMKL